MTFGQPASLTVLTCLSQLDIRHSSVRLSLGHLIVVQQLSGNTTFSMFALGRQLEAIVLKRYLSPP